LGNFGFGLGGQLFLLIREQGFRGWSERLLARQLLWRQDWCGLVSGLGVLLSRLVSSQYNNLNLLSTSLQQSDELFGSFLPLPFLASPVSG
jgi:hypothetical protein